RHGYRVRISGLRNFTSAAAVNKEETLQGFHLWNVSSLNIVELAFLEVGRVCRGPARVLERLFEAVARFLPHCICSGDLRARKDQLPSDKQRDRKSYPLQEDRRRERRRGGQRRYRQRL